MSLHSDSTTHLMATPLSYALKFMQAVPSAPTSCPSHLIFWYGIILIVSIVEHPDFIPAW